MQKTRIILILFILAILAQPILAYQLTSHSITIQINPDATDTVIEKYFIDFNSPQEKTDFREKSSSLGTLLEEWKKINPVFTPSLGEKAANKKVTYNEDPISYLQISYDLTESLMAKLKESTMMTEYTLKAPYFDSFYQAGNWVIPENTTISVELPPGAEIKDTVKPQADLTASGQRKVVNWQGYKSGTELALNYILWKKIEAVIDLNAISTFLFKTQEGLVLLALAIIILGVIVWKRKKISTIIEDFVEKNSEIHEE
jgi:hypothetical protein